MGTIAVGLRAGSSEVVDCGRSCCVVVPIVMSLKLDGFLRPYRGSGDDWDQFWSKFLVLADVSGWDTEEKAMSRFPLFL